VSDKRLTAGFLGLVAVLSATYLVTQQRLIWVVIGLGSAGMIAVGVHRYRPRRRAPWYAIMAALLALTIGDSLHYVLDHMTGQPPFRWIADLAYLAAFLPLMIIGMRGLARARVRAVNRASMLDALIVTSVLTWVSWTFLISPLLADSHYPSGQKLVAAAYPVATVFLVVLVIRLATAARWAPAVVPPALGMLTMLAVDAVYGLGQVRGDWLADGPAALGWFALYAGWAAGALHPSMASLTEPRPAPRQDLSWWRLAAVGTAALVPPVILIIESLGMPLDNAVRRSLILVLYSIVLVRLYTVVGSQRRGLERERTLCNAGAALVSATTVAEVTAVVRAAVNRLLPPGVRRDVVLEIDCPSAGLPAPSATPAAIGAWPPAGELSSVNRRDGLVTGRPRGPEAVLRCQVTLPGRDGDERLGVLYVTAPEAALMDLQAGVEVLASQAALAVDRIRLTGQINQHASEQYFRTLVQNTADMILIVDQAGGIRYASPSASAVLHDGHVTRLHDLVAHEDRPLIEQTLRRLRDDPGHRSASAEYTVVAAGGRRVRTEVSWRDLCADPTVGGVVVTLHDVTEQRRLQRELTHLAFHDALTGLANRALFYERLDRALVRGAHQDQLVGVLFVDLDDLKRVNDTMGHAAGDQLLIAAAHRFSGALGKQDTAARLGGDEFAARVEGLPGPEAADRVAQRVVAAFAEPFRLGTRSVRVGVSIGVATAAAGQDGEDLLRQADLALYEAKSAGKAQWQRFTPGRDPGRRRPPGEAAGPGGRASDCDVGTPTGAGSPDRRLPRSTVREAPTVPDPVETPRR
jgi:diguanylate cyclase (GGDEF)-like protein/PAS domain S-box-containing protein